MADIVVDGSRHGATITLRGGDTLRLTLAENPTTGFRWSVPGPDALAGVIALRGDRYVAASASPAPGAGGLRELCFGALRPGRVEVQLQLARPWEANAPRSTFRVVVEVVA
ncbi:MAG TPA: protease inhibitor I42 family protein [Burkholderiaceae bacterium]|nr:protease inhibitor I42 family protein [Burkholderiaceae bacterium]